MSCLYFILVLSSTFFFVTSLNATSFQEWSNSLNEDDVPSLRLINFGRKSYYIESILKANYYQAQRFCRYHGMHLLSITSKEENEFLNKQVQEAGNREPHFWTSGARLPDGQEWVWMSTGRSMKYSNWHPGEPNNAKNSSEDCLEIRNIGSGLKWNDVACNAQFYFICETIWNKNCYVSTPELGNSVVEK